MNDAINAKLSGVWAALNAVSKQSGGGDKMTHWTDIPQSLGACGDALDAMASYATFELFWRDCATPGWLLWAVNHGLVAVPPSFNAVAGAASDVYDAILGSGVAYEADVRAERKCFADCIRAAAEPFTLGPVWFTMWSQQENESPGHI